MPPSSMPDSSALAEATLLQQRQARTACSRQRRGRTGVMFKLIRLGCSDVLRREGTAVAGSWMPIGYPVAAAEELVPE